MSINNINNNQPAFTAKTKHGNDYDKTCAGKVVGGFLGAGAMAKGALGTMLLTKKADMFSFKQAPTVLADGKGTIIGAVFNENGAAILKKMSDMKKKSKAAIIIGGVTATVVAGATLLGAGAIVDNLINNHRAKKADKAAE